MYKPIIAAVALLIISDPTFAQNRKNIDELIASENAFSKLTLDSGAKKASLENFDSQSITFNKNQPVNGFDYWTNAPEKEPAVTRYPTMSATSADGSLGYNIGPSAIKNQAGNEKTRGYFFSVWKRDHHGKLKVILDGGVSKPVINDRPAETKLVDASTLLDNVTSKATVETTNIMMIDNNFNGDLVLSIDDAYKSALADKSWLLRTDSYATTTKPTNLQNLKDCKIAKYMLTCLGSGIATSNDLAYTYGTAELHVRTGPGTADYITGFYYRTWQKFGKKWKIVADMVSY